MRAVLLLVSVLVAAPAVAWIDSVEAPPVATVGELYTLEVRIILADNCWFLDGMQVLEEDLTKTIYVTTRNNGPFGTSCGGPMDLVTLSPEIVFLVTGLWNLRVIEHSVHPPFEPGDEVWDVPVEVSRPISAESGSWGAVKALYH